MASRTSSPSPDEPRQPDSSADDAAAAVRRVLSVADADLDYLNAKLVFDAIVDPSVDPTWVRTQIDMLAAAARALTRGDTRCAVRLGAVRTVLYEPGPWNDGRPFGFDMSDPDGRRIGNKLLHNYLRTRLGQCVSMPVLFLILAERLGLEVALCAAPDHILVRYTDETGRTHNIEASSGGHPARDEWICEQLRISDRALASGIYLRTLTRREGIAMLAHTIVEHLREQGRIDEVVSVCEAILQHHPREVNALVSLASACGELLERWRKQHPAPFAAPAEQVAYATSLVERNARLFAAAEELGWQPYEQEGETCT
jgi:regulator of sirC expression with transglutaminase-like and TPR domain